MPSPRLYLTRFQIGFVSYQKKARLLLCLAQRLPRQTVDSVEGRLVGHIIHDDNAFGIMKKWRVDVVDLILLCVAKFV
jgi:hypothetical protein